jgi:hypothetical protein
MFLSRLHRRITAWVALLALVLGALAPTVAQAVVQSGSQRADWMQVCSVSGMVWVQANPGPLRDQQPGGQAPMGDASPHCPWCTLHGGAPGLPTAHTPPALAPRLAGLPPAFYAAPLTATAWAPPPSRAPPLAG